MSVRSLPGHVRAHLYLWWLSLALGALGVIGFVASLPQVASPARAAIDVHTDIPWMAWTAIFLWAAGIALGFVARRGLHTAMREKAAADAAAGTVRFAEEDAGPAGPAGT